MLKIDALNSYYDDVHVLRDFNLSVNKGDVLCMLGRNGAGKTTALKSIMGLLKPRSGSVRLNNIDLTQLAAHEVPAQGVGYVPQGRRLFADLTVAENLSIGHHARPGISSQLDRLYQLFPVLEERLKQKAGTLSGGEQQMLATARALALDPILLLMDEPTEGLQPSMVEKIREVVLGLKETGVTIVIVEQRVDAVLPIADQVAFIENGRNRDTIPVQALADDPTLINRYVGVGH